MIRTLLDATRQDALYAVRALRREPGLAAGVVLTFALAIGANAAMFGLVGRLLLGAPPGVRDAGRVARISLLFASESGERFAAATTSYPAFRAINALGATLSAAAAVRTDTVTLGRGAELGESTALMASGDYFSVLGARPLMGRFFSPLDDELPSGSPVAVLSYRFWQRHFGGDRHVLNSEVVLNAQPFTIIGVAAPGFNGHELAPVDLFIPLSAAMRTSGPDWSTNARINLVEVIARRRDGVAAGTAGAAVVAAVRETMAGDERVRELAAADLTSLLPSDAARASPQARIALWLSGVSFVVLLIATANVGTLLLLRALRRRREIAVRIALGVGRGRLARQLLTESLLLSVTGGAVGLFVASWLADLIRATLLPGISSSDTFVDGRVLAATVAAALGAGLVAGCAPLLQSAQRDVIAELKTAASSASVRPSALRGTLVGLQVALCTVLLVGAGLFVRSLQRVQAQDLGFTTSHLLFVTLDFHTQLPAAEHDRLHRDAVDRLATLRGVTGATIVQGMPFGPHNIPPISVPGLAEPPGMGIQLPIMYAATPEYLRMMDVRLRDGRLFDRRDGRGSPFVVLVNETMARTVWPGQRAIGRCIRAGFDPSAAPGPLAPASLPCREVVGVVRDSRARSLSPEGQEAKLMQYYVPFGQLPSAPFGDAHEVSGMIVQTSGEAEAMAAAVQRQIQATSAVPVYARVRPYQDLLDPQLRSWRLGATLFSAFGALALGIAAVGLFGVVAYLVAQRTREIGIRLALGGTGVRVAQLVIGDALRMVSGGVAAGLALTLGFAPLVQSLLFQTSAREAVVLGAAGSLLLGVTACAAVVPAWRAARVSPLVALRAD